MMYLLIYFSALIKAKKVALHCEDCMGRSMNISQKVTDMCAVKLYL